MNLKYKVHYAFFTERVFNAGLIYWLKEYYFNFLDLVRLETKK